MLLASPSNKLASKRSFLSLASSAAAAAVVGGSMFFRRRMFRYDSEDDGLMGDAREMMDDAGLMGGGGETVARQTHSKPLWSSPICRRQVWRQNILRADLIGWKGSV